MHDPIADNATHSARSAAEGATAVSASAAAGAGAAPAPRVLASAVAAHRSANAA